MSVINKTKAVNKNVPFFYQFCKFKLLGLRSQKI